MDKPRIHSAQCGNLSCRRTLDLDKYRCGPPSDDFPEDMIHEVAYPAIALTRVQCSSCGHYTLYLRPSEMKNRT